MAEGLAVITGASTGLGFKFARLAAQDGRALFICADEPAIRSAAERLREEGARVEAILADLSTRGGMEAMRERLGDRRIDLFFASAGRALGQAFREQPERAVRGFIALNVLQTSCMLHRAGRPMHRQGGGRMLVTGSIGGFAPGPFDAVNNATKAYLDSICYALQDEWRDDAVTLTCLMPGPLDTEIFHRPDNLLQDTPAAQDLKKGDPAEAAREAYEALMKGERGVIPYGASKLITLLSGFAPSSVLARIHRRGAEPKSR